MDLALNNAYDLYLAANGDLASTTGFDTAVKVSCLCDIRVSADEEPMPERRRGWIGDAPEIKTTTADLGSRLWILGQRKKLEDYTAEAEQHIAQSLEWLITLGSAKLIEPTVEVGLTGLDGTVKIVSIDDKVETVMITSIVASL